MLNLICVLTVSCEQIPHNFWCLLWWLWAGKCWLGCYMLNRYVKYWMVLLFSEFTTIKHSLFDDNFQFCGSFLRTGTFDIHSHFVSYICQTSNTTNFSIIATSSLEFPLVLTVSWLFLLPAKMIFMCFMQSLYHILWTERLHHFLLNYTRHNSSTDFFPKNFCNWLYWKTSISKSPVCI